MNLGVVGNGMIVKRLLTDVKKLPEITVTAICVREQSRDKGEALAREYGIARVYTEYAAFLADGELDTVYLGIANHMHYPYARQAMEAGRHVICEKPFTVTAGETKALADMARQRGLFLWEAFKIPYSPLFPAVKAHLGDVGEIKLVQCNYSRISSRYGKYQAGEILPAFDPDCAGGCLYDINLYNLHFVTALFGKPEKVYYFANLGYNGIDTSGTAVLQYKGFHAVCTGAKDSTSPCYGLVQGTGGCIRLEGPVSSAAYAELVTGDGTVRLAEDPESGSLTDELREFARQLAAGDREACLAMLDHSVMMMEVVEDAARQIRQAAGKI